VFAVDYISTIEAGEKWNLSHRRVATLCSEGRIPGVKKVGNTWLIPADADKPADARIKTGKYMKSNNEVIDDGNTN
jgi:hypothetical protein